VIGALEWPYSKKTLFTKNFWWRLFPIIYHFTKSAKFCVACCAFIGIVDVKIFFTVVASKTF